MTGIVFLDTETTGLHPTEHDIWEVGLITDEYPDGWRTFVELTEEQIARADPTSLDIGRFHERHPQSALNTYLNGQTRCFPNEGAQYVSPPVEVAYEVARATHGKHLVGACPWFDAQRLERLMHRYGIVPSWHHHLIDVEALAVGYLCGLGAMHADYRRPMWVEQRTPPWRSGELSKAIGVASYEFEKHTALGDARWAKAIYERITQ